MGFKSFGKRLFASFAVIIGISSCVACVTMQKAEELQSCKAAIDATAKGKMMLGMRPETENGSVRMAFIAPDRTVTELFLVVSKDKKDAEDAGLQFEGKCRADNDGFFYLARIVTEQKSQQAQD